MREACSDEHRKLFEAVGFLSLTWASMEMSLDAIINHIHEAHGGRAALKVLPRSLSQKATYLKKACAILPAMKPHAADASELLDELGKLAEMRHWCIHGCVARADMPLSGPYQFTKADRGDRYVWREKAFSVEEIDLLSLRCSVLGMNLFFFSSEAVGFIPVEEVEKLLRKFGVQIP